ncbi:hypothetical protein DCAR_0102498 [Daucus carota subsp. sativus]|uniref:Protein kinase domain-containing protein n=1 Tax=Daucus carota subsp. sativus TaxID=79200 RepID=A0A166H5C9_DAUCS|nr:hypothetical protein DCAR_0102498 [Daucus carota subsp. sativus]
MSATTNLKIFKLIDLIKATSNFEEVLGKGGSIDVFKGWVHEKSYDPSTPDIGLPVAVKRFIPEREPGHKKWQMELDLSREYSHPNFVKLVGYCCEAQEHLLVYEYMQNSGLDTHIFKSASQTMKTARIALPLQARLKIIMGAARCLAFLHTSEQSVIYGDFKTSRILLDGKFIAKLSPQGLTRLAPSDSNTERYDGALHDAASESSKPFREGSVNLQIPFVQLMARNYAGKAHEPIDPRFLVSDRMTGKSVCLDSSGQTFSKPASIV